MKNKKNIILGTLAVTLGIFSIASYVYKSGEKKKLQKAAAEHQQSFVRSYSPTMGPDDAPVTLVEFLDPECESCRAFYPFVKNLMKKYEGKIKLVQ